MVMPVPMMLVDNSTVSPSVSKNLNTVSMAVDDASEQPSQSFVLPELTYPTSDDLDAQAEPSQLPALPTDGEPSCMPNSMVGSLLLLPQQPQPQQQPDDADDGALSSSSLSAEILPMTPIISSAPVLIQAPIEQTANATPGAVVQADMSGTGVIDVNLPSSAQDNGMPLTAAMWPQNLISLPTTAPLSDASLASTGLSAVSSTAPAAVQYFSTSNNAAAASSTSLQPSPLVAALASGLTEQTFNSADAVQSASVKNSQALSVAGLMQIAVNAAVATAGQTKGMTDVLAASQSANPVMSTTSVSNTVGNLPNTMVLETRTSASSAIGQQLVNLLSDKVQLQYESKTHNAQIRLDPPRLGSIDIRISVDGDRTVVHINASHAAVKDAVSQTTEQLRASLTHKLGGDVIVQTGDNNRQQQGQQAPQFGEQEGVQANHLEIADDEELVMPKVDGWLNRKA
ncbi:flagellar hook-length control protein FliK [Shewanella sp. A32]|uniref:flagellar hook-length control protein FliK n=1 Tax=Shewanella sp. A32 TaxID=3031327 RepID=UPI0023BA3604|nr:flagellar hook-length control protein FliK [Shewanella sp. A32]MDF0535727.1 flagellar hook-length control protein FliK [Shewanella sp. A32]